MTARFFLAEATLGAILLELCDAARRGAPCPKNLEIGEAVGISDRAAGNGVQQLLQAQRLQVEYAGNAARRIRVREAGAGVGGAERWGPWTDWTKPNGPSAREGYEASGTWGPRRGEMVASVETLAARRAASPTVRRIETLLRQGYPPRTVARLAGLRPHEMDLVGVG